MWSQASRRLTNFLGFSFLALCISLPWIVQPSVFAQTEWQNPDVGWLQEVMPAADRFSSKQGEPPVFRAFKTAAENAEPELIGYVFTTPDLPPVQLGFSGPIDTLVGMDLQGRLTGVKILHYRESYRTLRGDFIEDSGFPEQFRNKTIEEEFRVGRDIDGMSRATISSWAVARGVRNAARRVATTYLADSTFVAEANFETEALFSLQQKSWEELIESGFVKQLSVPLDDRTELRLFVAYMGHYRLGELLVGATDYSNADREASIRVDEGSMLLIGIGGNAPRLRQLRLAVLQNGSVYPNRRNRFVFAGSGKEGKIAGQVQFAAVMILDPAIDIAQPFSVIYDTGPITGEFSEFVSVDYQLAPEVLALIQGPTLPDELSAAEGMASSDLTESAEEPIASWIARNLWSGLIALVLILILTIATIRRKGVN